MKSESIIEFISANPVCSLATLSENKPHVRGFLSNIIDGKLYFTTAASKRVAKQLVTNPEVALCYFSQDFSRMLRIEGHIVFCDDKTIKQTIINMRDYLQGFSADDPEFMLLTVEGTGTFWSLTDNLHERELEALQL